MKQKNSATIMNQGNLIGTINDIDLKANDS